MSSDRKPPLWSWKVVRDVPATKHYPRYIEKITYYKGRPQTINRRYVLPPGSEHRRNYTLWPTTGRKVDNPGPGFAPIMFGITVAFWFFIHVLTEV